MVKVAFSATVTGELNREGEFVLVHVVSMLRLVPGGTAVAPAGAPDVEKAVQVPQAGWLLASRAPSRDS
jgi:hypothetical protein